MSHELRVCRMSCAYGGQFISNLAAFKGSVFVIANGLGYDTVVSDTLMPDANATLFTYPGCGHMDHFLAADHFDIPEQPLDSGWPRTHSHPSLGSRCHDGTSGWLVARFGENSGLSQEHGAASLRNDIVHR